MNPRTKTMVLIVVAVAILAGIILYVSLRNGPSAPAAQPSTTALGSPAFAPKGELVSGFPKELILDNSAAITGSYSINYSSSTNQYTAEWNSSSSMATLYDAYKAYLPAHAWTVVNDVTKYPTSRGLYARNASADVSVAIVAQGGGSQVVLTYLAK